MTEQFDAEEWLRDESGEYYGDYKDKLMQCADELAAAKARIAELEKQLEERKSTNAGWRAYANLNETYDALYSDFKAIESERDYLEAEQAISRKLYEALTDCVDDSAELLVEYEQRYGTNYKQDRLAEQRRVVTAAREAIAEYENKERK